jgi:hypothetical protein
MLGNEHYSDEADDPRPLRHHERRIARLGGGRVSVDSGRGAAPSRVDHPTGLHRRRSRVSDRGVQPATRRRRCRDLGVHLLGQSNQQRVYWEVPTPGSKSGECLASTATQCRRHHLRMRFERRPGPAALRPVQDRLEDRDRRRQPLHHHGRTGRVRRRADPKSARIYPARAARRHPRLRLLAARASPAASLITNAWRSSKVPTSSAASSASPKPISARSTPSSILLMSVKPGRMVQTHPHRSFR